MHPRPSPIAAALYTLRDLDADLIVLHGPKGCCFRTARLLEQDGVRVVTTGMSEKDFVFGAEEKLTKTLKKAYKMFSPKLIGVVGTCASMIIGENLKRAVENAKVPAKVLIVESHGGFGEGDNTEGAIAVLEVAAKERLISEDEARRQIKMLRMATAIEKTRGMAQGKYIPPLEGDNKKKVAKIVINAFKNGKKVAMVLNAKKETAYLFADVLRLPYSKLNGNPVVIANLDENIGLPRIRNHAKNIKKELKDNGVNINYITGGLDEYPVTGKKAMEILEKEEIDFAVVSGIPHALPIEKYNNIEMVAVTDGPRLVEPLKNIGYKYVVLELDAHAKTLGKRRIVNSEFGNIIRSEIS